MSPPWMPLYVADYLRDTRRLHAREHGAYLLLIMEYWTAGSLPSDDAELARLAALSDREWREVRPKLLGFFGPNWTHARIDHELTAAQVKYERRAAAGKAGGNARAAGKQKPSNASLSPEARRIASSVAKTKHPATNSELTYSSGVNPSEEGQPSLSEGTLAEKDPARRWDDNDPFAEGRP